MDYLTEAFMKQIRALQEMNPCDCMPLNDDYQEILKLHEMLEEHEIPHFMNRLHNGWVIHYPVYAHGPEEGHVCSCIQHLFSYGASHDRLELMGLTTDEEDDPQGWLSAVDVFSRIEAHWRASRENA